MWRSSGVTGGERWKAECGGQGIPESRYEVSETAVGYLGFGSRWTLHVATRVKHFPIVHFIKT